MAPLVALIALAGCRSDGSAKPADRGPGVESRPVRSAAPTGPATLTPRVRVTTSLGEFTLELDGENAPMTVTNFVDYVLDGYYEGTIIHRVANEPPTRVVQGGRYVSDMSDKTGGLRPPVRSEWSPKSRNLRGSIGMTRRFGVLNSATTEFYINLQDNPALDGPRDGAGWTVFGRVVEGWEVVEKMAGVAVAAHPKFAEGRSAVVPTTPITIRSMELLNALDREKAEQVAARLLNLNELLSKELIQKLEGESGRKFVTSESGLKYIDMVEGKGAHPVEHGKIEMYYRGTFLDGREFEAKMNEAVTYEFDSLIPGLKEGLATMREGGKRYLIVPPSLAFGEGGFPGKIPSDTTLVYYLELLRIY